MEEKHTQLMRSRTMLAPRPMGHISASDVRWESELEGSDPDRGCFLEVGGRVTAVGEEETVRVYVAVSRGGS